MKRRLFLALPLIACATVPAHAASSDTAARIFQIIDAMDVEHLWPAGQHVNWRTGIPDGKPVGTEGKHTHCSAFVAAAAEKLGIYILRPPEHSAKLLANAQVEWLNADGQQQGWVSVPDMAEAQDKANAGFLVVAAYHNYHDDKPGHIAIIRPGSKPSGLFAQEGPDVTQAGENNYVSNSLKQGFKAHPAAWRDHEIQYFAHAVDPGAISN